MTGSAAEWAAGSPCMLAKQRAARDALREHRGDPTAAESVLRLPCEDEASPCQQAAVVRRARCAQLRRPPQLGSGGRRRVSSLQPCS